MKPSGLVALFFCLSCVALAQQATDVDLQRKAAPRSSQTEAPPNPDLPERSQIDEVFKQTSLGKAADERRLHLEWRQLANQVTTEPRIVAAKEYVKLAKTDLEKRERLRDYYELYYGRMRSLASSDQMKAALDTLKIGHLALTTQPRVRPGSDLGLPTPTPGPKRKAKRHSWERATEGN